MDHVTKDFKILSGQMCKLTVFPVGRLSNTGTITDGVMSGMRSLTPM